MIDLGLQLTSGCLPSPFLAFAEEWEVQIVIGLILSQQQPMEYSQSAIQSWPLSDLKTNTGFPIPILLEIVNQTELCIP